MRGKTVPADVLDALVKIVEKKYPELVSNGKLNTPEDIKGLFVLIGNNIDVKKICDEADQGYDTTTPPTCGCDDGTIQKAREVILLDKGLSADIVNDIIDDIKKQAEIIFKKPFNIKINNKYFKGFCVHYYFKNIIKKIIYFFF